MQPTVSRAASWTGSDSSASLRFSSEASLATSNATTTCPARGAARCAQSVRQETEGSIDPMRFVTRKNAAVDRIACPRLIIRFLDADAEFLYVDSADVH